MIPSSRWKILARLRLMGGIEATITIGFDLQFNKD